MKPVQIGKLVFKKGLVSCIAHRTWGFWKEEAQVARYVWGNGGTLLFIFISGRRIELPTTLRQGVALQHESFQTCKATTEPFSLHSFPGEALSYQGHQYLESRYGTGRSSAIRISDRPLQGPLYMPRTGRSSKYMSDAPRTVKLGRHKSVRWLEAKNNFISSGTNPIYIAGSEEPIKPFLREKYIHTTLGWFILPTNDWRTDKTESLRNLVSRFVDAVV